MKYPILATRTIHENWTKVPLTMTVEGGLHNIAGNHAPYFSLTVNIHRKGFPNQCQSGGADHKRILRYFPKFADLAKLNLSDIDGAPMHTVENGWYWLGMTKCEKYNRDNLAKHLRITPEEADSIHADFTQNEKTKNDFVALVNSMRPRWKQEADACIKRHNLQVFGDKWG